MNETTAETTAEAMNDLMNTRKRNLVKLQTALRDILHKHRGTIEDEIPDHLFGFQQMIKDTGQAFDRVKPWHRDYRFRVPRGRSNRE